MLSDVKVCDDYGHLQDTILLSLLCGQNRSNEKPQITEKPADVS